MSEARKFIKDRFWRAKGKKSCWLQISCSNCGNFIAVYQKDGPTGSLLRMYINRIHEPDTLAQLKHDSKVVSPSDVKKLRCQGCSQLIGVPTRHIDGRIALRMLKGTYVKKRIKGDRNGTKS